MKRKLKKMSLNDSVIICEATPKSRKKKASKTKNAQKSTKRTFYENPLKYIQLSGKKKKQKQVNNNNQVSNSKKDLFLFGKESLQDSIIILSDNESESNNKRDEIKSNQETKSRKRFLDLSIDDEISLCDSNETVSQRKSVAEKPLRKKRKVGIAALSENNFTCPTISDTSDLEITTLDLDDENIAPVSSNSVHQVSDDIVVVWSSTKTALSSANTVPTSTKIIPVSTNAGSQSTKIVPASTQTVPASAKTVSTSIKTIPASTKTVSTFTETVSTPTMTISTSTETISTSIIKTTLASIETVSTSTKIVSPSKIVPCAKTLAPFVNQSEQETVNLEKNDRIFMIDNTPNLRNLNCLQHNENSLHVEDKGLKERDDIVLPFSKHGIKLPKAQDISKNIVMKKPRTIQRLKNFRRQVSNHTTSAMCTTYNTIGTSSTSSTSTVSNIPLPSAPFPTSSIPVVYNMQTTYEYFNLHDSANSGFQTRIGSSSELTYPQLSTVGSSTRQLPNKLREIIIDGNNIAMSYRNNKIFTEEGIRIVVEYFQKRGHTVKVFVPHYRRSCVNYPLLEKLHTDGIVIFTPSRFIGGKRITPYDDRYILEYATMCGGVVVSLDQYRDLYSEKPEWRDTIEKRLLTPTFVGNYVMFPEDPLGRGGPTLEEFLRY